MRGNETTKSPFGDLGLPRRGIAMIQVMIAAALVAALAVDSAGAVTLVHDGAARACIVLPAKPTREEERSAKELQKYVRLMSGAELAIESGEAPKGDAVLIGRHPLSMKSVGKLLNDETLGYDGVIIRTVGNRLIVVGNKGDGQLYAVYELLRRLGCRFYLPWPDGEVIPAKKTIVVDSINYVHKPDFVRREFWNNGYVVPGLAHPDWYSDWQPRVYHGGPTIGHGHAYGYICPKDKYFAEHPEYFPLLPDKDGNMQRKASGQLCLSNPDVVKLAVDYSLARFDSPNHKGSSLSPNDTKGWCQCDKCKAMDSPDPNVGVAWRALKFNNEGAEAVSKKDPDRWPAYYAEYMNLPGPPVGMKADPMILPLIVDRYDMMHSVHDTYLGDTSKTGIHYNVDYRRIFGEWRKIAKQTMSYEWYQLAKPPQLPSPMLYPIGERIKFYKEQGVVGYGAELIGRCPVTDLTIYMASQMLWDAEQNPRQLLDEFFKLYFAEAASQMQEYYRLLHEVSYFSNENRGCYVPRSAWSPDLIARLYAQLDRADKTARQDVVKRRLGRERKSLIVTDKCADAFRTADPCLDNGDQAAGIEAEKKAQDAIAYLNSIADEDIVADTRMIRFLEDLIKQIDSKLPNDSDATSKDVDQIAH
jgi:hypothetical protein